MGSVDHTASTDNMMEQADVILDAAQKIGSVLSDRPAHLDARRRKRGALALFGGTAGIVDRVCDRISTCKKMAYELDGKVLVAKHNGPDSTL